MKSYTYYSGYKSALPQAAMYGKQLELKEVLLVFFLEAIDKQNREKYEKDFLDESTGVKMKAEEEDRLISQPGTILS